MKTILEIMIFYEHYYERSFVSKFGMPFAESGSQISLTNKSLHGEREMQ